MTDAEVSVFDAVGGQGFFDDLVERFYRAVATDLLLRPLYPDDLSGSERHLALFLGQYWGGPTTYSNERGHPRLRMRHAPFVVGEPERDAWLRHMNAALDALNLHRKRVLFVAGSAHDVGGAARAGMDVYWANRGRVPAPTDGRAVREEEDLRGLLDVLES